MMGQDSKSHFQGCSFSQNAGFFSTAYLARSCHGNWSKKTGFVRPSTHECRSRVTHGISVALADNFWLIKGVSEHFPV